MLVLIAAGILLSVLLATYKSPIPFILLGAPLAAVRLTSSSSCDRNSVIPAWHLVWVCALPASLVDNNVGLVRATEISIVMHLSVVFKSAHSLPSFRLLGC